MIDRRPVTQAVAQLLATLTGKPVGQGVVPLDSAGRPVPPPYTLLYPLEQDNDDGTLADNGSAAVASYQATFVSGPVPGNANSRGTVEQAEWLADKARAILARPADGSPGYAHPLTIPGVICYRRTASEAGATSEAEDAIITSVIRFQFYLEAAA
ncbi:hypothetical protein [Streptomyces olivaceiscleroticus]|uniref:DUF3168 domain-containing protein n=1 Tax=Streptomyces olivaceiscleroticus TaxID=68245 RepID=A0ABP3LJX0_9ACTN